MASYGRVSVLLPEWCLCGVRAWVLYEHNMEEEGEDNGGDGGDCVLYMGPMILYLHYDISHCN